jgi:hypothetical protein
MRGLKLSQYVCRVQFENPSNLQELHDIKPALPTLVLRHIGVGTFQARGKLSLG